MLTQYMEKAYEEAQKAYDENEVPVGCVIVYKDTIISHAHNTAESDKNSLRHAELSAIETAVKIFGKSKLSECTIYVTLEPCPMCAWAIVLSGIKTAVFGAFDLKCGAFGSVFDLSKNNKFSDIEVYGGILEEKCSDILKDFFRKIR